MNIHDHLKNDRMGAGGAGAGSANHIQCIGETFAGPLRFTIRLELLMSGFRYKRALYSRTNSDRKNTVTGFKDRIVASVWGWPQEGPAGPSATYRVCISPQPGHMGHTDAG